MVKFLSLKELHRRSPPPRDQTSVPARYLTANTNAAQRLRALGLGNNEIQLIATHSGCLGDRELPNPLDSAVRQREWQPARRGRMARDGEEAADRRRKRDTWIRLASSCKRAVARGLTVIPLLPDLYEEDYRVIALQGLAGTITDMADGSAAS